ncbi:amidase [Vineibacter terrae]|uniref:Amidase n=1 Tax=Vineibacter terrae TaxID=2586908 RepID=A0A5C8PPK6_9HYPH|nr:amidase [Vineibacter terrae]TXL76766.1 amidase [Vineibacter terrae]
MDLGYRTATALLSDLGAGRVGSVELLDHLLARAEKLNPAINAIVVRDTEEARARAAQADAARRRGESWGPLHGLPMTVKECFDVAGLPTTAGAPALKANAAQRHADAVQRLVDAGAVIFGKTNVPLFAGDLQSYNDVYGTTNNPWDTSRGPGGSSGGSAAALAAGLTPLELGSDIGGSIRNPAHFCGVYGHKPSYGLISVRGHVPGPPNSLLQVDIGVAGPLARSAEDLDLALAVLAGPDEFDAPAWRVELPAPRQAQLRDYRIAICADDPFCPVDAEIAGLIRATAAALAKAGAKVADARPDLDFGQSFRHFYQMLAATLAAGFPEPVLQGLEARAKAAADDSIAYADLFARGASMRHAAYNQAAALRQQQRAAWGRFFGDWDVFLCPVVPMAAFPHDHSPDMLSRRLTVNGTARPYGDALCWAGLIGNVRLPATVVPIGRTKAGLPVGMQIVGPYLEDRTPIDVARRLADLIGGFAPPPGYA